MDSLGAIPAFARRGSEVYKQSQNLGGNYTKCSHNNLRTNELTTLTSAGLFLVPIPTDNDGKPIKAPILNGWNAPRSPENPNGYSSIQKTLTAVTALISASIMVQAELWRSI